METKQSEKTRFQRRFRNYTLALAIFAAIVIIVAYIGAAMFDRIYAGISEDLDKVETETMALTPTPTAAPTPEPEPTPEPAPEPSPEPVRIPCDPETADRLSVFADAFTEAYYNYFGTRYADYYYQQLLSMVAEGSELRERMDMSYWDHEWINTGYNSLENKSLDAAYQNEDGSYTVECSLDITEHAAYWTYADRLELKIICIPDEYNVYGFRAIATE